MQGYRSLIEDVCKQSEMNIYSIRDTIELCFMKLRVTVIEGFTFLILQGLR